MFYLNLIRNRYVDMCIHVYTRVYTIGCDGLYHSDYTSIQAVWSALYHRHNDTPSLSADLWAHKYMVFANRNQIPMQLQIVITEFYLLYCSCSRCPSGPANENEQTGCFYFNVTIMRQVDWKWHQSSSYYWLVISSSKQVLPAFENQHVICQRCLFFSE